MAESKITSVLPNNSVIDVMPGKPISTVYANNDNLLKPLELVQYNNDVEMSFPSPAFGATNTFRFPRAYQFLKNITMVLSFDFTAGLSVAIKEDYLAYHIIKEIKWQLGGTEQLTIKGESLLHIALAQCETQEKKDRLLDLAGYAQDSTANATPAAVGLRGNRKFICMLPLPWCSLESKKMSHSQYPLPLHMLNEPLELQITFRSNTECFTGVTDSWFKSAVLNFEYAKIASPNQLKNTVYKYPFISNFSFSYNVSVDKADVSIELNSFRKGELRGISFSYVPSVANGVNCYYTSKRLSDISLNFNGQTIWKCPKNELYELIYGKTENITGRRKLIKVASNTVDYQYNPRQLSTTSANELLDPLAATGGTDLLAPLEASLIVYRGEVLSGTDTDIGGNKCNKYYYYIPLSEIKDFSQNYTLGVDASKQSLQLNFIRPDTVANGKVFVTYHYSACYQFDGDNAVLIF